MKSTRDGGGGGGGDNQHSSMEQAQKEMGDNL